MLLMYFCLFVGECILCSRWGAGLQCLTLRYLCCCVSGAAHIPTLRVSQRRAGRSHMVQVGHICYNGGHVASIHHCLFSSSGW